MTLDLSEFCIVERLILQAPKAEGTNDQGGSTFREKFGSPRRLRARGEGGQRKKLTRKKYVSVRSDALNFSMRVIAYRQLSKTTAKFPVSVLAKRS